MKVLTLCYAPSLQGFDDRPLSEFVRDKEVLQVREHFFSVHDLPHLACLVTYQDPAPGKAPPSAQDRRGERPDPAADLEPEHRALFGTLREWRAARSRKDGVPPYVLFTNRELIAIVRARPKTASALLTLDGIGPAKVERYGQALLEIVNGASS